MSANCQNVFQSYKMYFIMCIRIPLKTVGVYIIMMMHGVVIITVLIIIPSEAEC